MFFLRRLIIQTLKYKNMEQDKEFNDLLSNMHAFRECTDSIINNLDARISALERKIKKCEDLAENSKDAF